MEEVDVDVMVILKIIFRGIGHEFVDIFNYLTKLTAGSFFVKRTVNL